MAEKVCFLLCMEGSLFPLPQDDMTMDVDIFGYDATVEFICDRYV